MHATRKSIPNHIRKRDTTPQVSHVALKQHQPNPAWLPNFIQGWATKEGFLALFETCQSSRDPHLLLKPLMKSQYLSKWPTTSDWDDIPGWKKMRLESQRAVLCLLQVMCKVLKKTENWIRNRSKQPTIESIMLIQIYQYVMLGFRDWSSVLKFQTLGQPTKRIEQQRGNQGRLTLVSDNNASPCIGLPLWPMVDVFGSIVYRLQLVLVGRICKQKYIKSCKF